MNHEMADFVTGRRTFGRAELFWADVLSGPEVCRAVEALDSVRSSLWTLKSDVGGSRMYTVGQPVYQNAQNMELYYISAKRDNGTMFSAFEDLYERAALYLETELGSTVKYVEELALPGFHVFEFADPGSYAGGGWHFDLVHLRVPYFAQRAHKVQGVVNFTLALEVPSGGTHMDLCDRRPESRINVNEEMVAFPYRVGRMLLLKDQYWHRIGASKCQKKAERRVTFQGHGVKMGGVWYLFW